MSMSKKAEMAKQAAFDIIAENVYNPVFFSKLASYGIVPRSEAEAQVLLKTAHDVRLAAMQTFGSVDHGTPDPELVKEAHAYLKKNSRIKSAAVILAYQ